MVHARRYYRLLITCVLSGALLLWVAGAWIRSADYRHAAQALEDRRFQDCITGCTRILEQDPGLHEARLLLAQALAGRHDWERAAEEFQKIPASDPDLKALAEFGLGEGQLVAANHDRAEYHFKKCLELDPHHLKANQRMCFMLQLQGRSWESLPYAAELVRQYHFKADELVMLGTPHALWVKDEDRRVNYVNRARPHSMFEFGPLRSAVLRNHAANVVTPLKALIKSNPGQTEPLILLGTIYFQQGDLVQFESWLRSHMVQLQGHPEFWYLSGLWAQTQDEQIAARCHLAAQLITPRHYASAFQLAQSPLGISDELKRKMIDRSTAVPELDFQLFELRGRLDRTMMHKAVSHLRDLGRDWEAAAWCELLLRFYPDEVWAKDALLDSRERLTDAGFDSNAGAITERLVAEGVTPASLSDLKQLLDAQPKIVEPGQSIAPAPVATHVSFRELGAESGLDFQYYNGTTPELGLVHIIEATGGATAVLDYDLDGWPDLYFAQSGVWPVEEADNPYRDRLFRNLGNETFRDVTEEAGLGDGRYSQGVSIADFDNDGDPDLFLTNVGANRLYWNQGDGTFKLQEFSEFGDAPVWSMSAGAGDLNHDGLLDLYVVNYLKIQQVLDQACKHEGQPRGCSPTMFDGEQDRVWLNRGDGTFEDVTRICGFEVKGGKGLGIVIADYDGEPGVEIYVGNDTVANFFFQQMSNNSGALPRYENRALISGTALDSRGRAQASMGIASGDLNSDGRFDLFITNFYGDANIFYAGQESHLFRDQTRQANLFDNGFHQLGFGTQAFDLERDGDLDLLVLNGHIDRTFATGEPDLMPPQLLINQGGRFEEVAPELLPSYFHGKYFGRSVALLDVNRDGRCDCAVSHLESPARVLVNESPSQLGFMRIHLIGKQSSRWPVGATLKLTAGDFAQTAWVTSGDGYLSGNEQVITLTIPTVSPVGNRLEVKWPSGRVTSFENLPADAEISIIEGEGGYYPWDRSRDFSP